MNVNLSEMAEILKEDKPLSGWMAHENGEDKIFFLAVLPELSEKVIEFANQLLKDEGF